MSEPSQSWLHNAKGSPPKYPQDLEGSGPSSTLEKPFKIRLKSYFESKVDHRNADHILLLCWLTTGLLDSTIFNAYRTFVSMQTGNTMFLGLGASNYDTTTRPYSWAKSLVSLVCFICGAFAFSRLGQYLGASRRRTLLLSSLIQASIILLCAILVETGIVEGRLEYIGEDIDWIHIIPIALLSFQAPGQVWLTRDLSYAEVSTVVVSTMLYDFGSDPSLFDGLRRNAARNRRFFGFCMLLTGAIAGGWITKKSRYITIPMWMAGTIKIGIVGAWAVWPAEEKVRRWGF